MGRFGDSRGVNLEGDSMLIILEIAFLSMAVGSWATPGVEPVFWPVNTATGVARAATGVAWAATSGISWTMGLAGPWSP